MLQCLPAAGYNRHFPREVVYGPTDYGDMQWESLQAIQTVEKVKFCLTHIRRQKKLGDLLLNLIESVQFQSGLSESVLNTKCRWELYVENTWITSLKYSLNTINGGIVTNHRIPMVQRQYDWSLMDIFCR